MQGAASDYRMLISFGLLLGIVVVVVIIQIVLLAVIFLILGLFSNLIMYFFMGHLKSSCFLKVFFYLHFLLSSLDLQAIAFHMLC